MPMNDTPVNGKIMNAAAAVTVPYTCLTTTYSAAYLESVTGQTARHCDRLHGRLRCD